MIKMLTYMTISVMLAACGSNVGRTGQTGDSGKDGTDGTDGKDGDPGVVMYELTLPTVGLCEMINETLYVKNTGKRVRFYDATGCGGSAIARLAEGQVFWYDDVQYSKIGNNSETVLKMLVFQPEAQ